MDGKVLKKIFKEDTELARREVTYQEDEGKMIEQEREEHLSKEDDEKIRRKLKALGYID